MFNCNDVVRFYINLIRNPFEFKNEVKTMPDKLLTSQTPKNVSKKPFDEESLRTSPAKVVKDLHRCLSQVERVLTKIANDRPLTNTDRQDLVRSIDKVRKLVSEENPSLLNQGMDECEVIFTNKGGDLRKIQSLNTALTDVEKILKSPDAKFSTISGRTDLKEEKNTENLSFFQQKLKAVYEILPSIINRLT